MCENKQKPELEPEPEPWRKKGLQRRSHTHENHEHWRRSYVHEKKLWSRSCVIFTTAPQLWKILSTEKYYWANV